MIGHYRSREKTWSFQRSCKYLDFSSFNIKILCFVSKLVCQNLFPVSVISFSFMGTLIFASLTVFHFIRVTSVTDLIHYSWTPHPEATHDERSWYKSNIHGIYMVSVIKWKFFWAQNDALTDKFISVKYFLTFHLLQLLWIYCTTNLEVFRNKIHQKMVSSVEKQPKIVCLIFINIFSWICIQQQN